MINAGQLHQAAMECQAATPVMVELNGQTYPVASVTQRLVRPGERAIIIKAGTHEPQFLQPGDSVENENAFSVAEAPRCRCVLDPSSEREYREATLNTPTGPEDIEDVGPVGPYEASHSQGPAD